MTELNEPMREAIKTELLNTTLDYFGTAEEFRDAGFITPQGSLVDLQYSRFDDENYIPEDFTGAHAAISRAFEDKPEKYWPNGWPTSYSVDYPDEATIIGTFLDYTGSVRIKNESDEALSLATVHVPTEKQVDAILQHVRQKGIPSVNLDIQDNDGNIKNSVTYETFLPSAIQNALRGK